MKICMIVWSYWPVPTGGAEGQCRKLSKCLVGSGVDCTVLTTRLRVDTPARERDGLVKIVRIAVPQMIIELIIGLRDRYLSNRGTAGNSADVQASANSISGNRGRKLASLVKWMNTLAFICGATGWLTLNRRKIDVIHVHIGGWIAGYAGWIGMRMGIPVVCKASDMPALPIIEDCIPFRSVWTLWRRRINYVAMHSEIKNELMNCGIALEKIHLIPNGVEIAAHTAKPGQGNYVLFVGNFSQGAHHKGFDVLLKAWAEVTAKFPDSMLVMAGGGDSKQWENMAYHLECSGNILFAGYVPHMDDLYYKAGLFVLPSLHEGMSNALLEAQSWGVPAIVSDIPGNRAVVENEISGKIVPAGDHLALANAIIELLSFPGIRDEMGANARLRVEKYFSMEHVTKEYAALYRILTQHE